MSNMLGEDESRSRGVPIAMIAFGLFAVFMGLLNPGGSERARPANYNVEQRQLVRGDANAGFPPPPLPDNPPRGPGE